MKANRAALSRYVGIYLGGGGVKREYAVFKKHAEQIIGSASPPVAPASSRHNGDAKAYFRFGDGRSEHLVGDLPIPLSKTTGLGRSSDTDTTAKSRHRESLKINCIPPNSEADTTSTIPSVEKLGMAGKVWAA